MTGITNTLKEAAELLLNQEAPAVNIGSAALEKEYRAADGVSQSILKNLPDSLKEQEDKDPTSPMKIGSYVDSLLFRGQEATDEAFHVSIMKPPTESVFNVLKTLDARGVDIATISPEKLNEEILIACDENGYRTGNKPETRIKYIATDIDYLAEIAKSHSHTVLSPEEFVTGNTVANSLRDHEYTKKNFEPPAQQGVKVFYQWPVFAEITADGETYKVKGLLDMLAVNWNQKSILIKDLKTMNGNVLGFQYQAKKFGYHIQASLYHTIVSAIFGEDFKVKFGFIVESTTNTGTPVEYSVSSDYLDMGFRGKPASFGLNGDQIRAAEPGLVDYLRHYKYYTENNTTVHPAIAGNEGLLSLTSDFDNYEYYY